MGKRPKPGYLVDRCISPDLALAIKVFGVEVVHLSELYPRRADERIPDEMWMEEAARLGLSVLTQNFKIRLQPHEVAALHAFGTRVFCLAKGDHPHGAKAAIFGRHWPAIQRRHQQPGPCFWRLYPDRITRDVP